MQAHSLPDRTARAPRPARWPGLDGLRALAIVLVLAGHVGRDTSVAAVGVELFFVLSGFLITGILLDEHERTGGIRIGLFWTRRALRIFPAFYASLLVAMLILWSSPERPAPGAWISSATYTSNYYFALHPHPTPLSHTWSLAVEEQFYLVWPVALTILLRGGYRRAIMGLAVLTIVVTGWRLWLQNVVGIAPGYLYFAFDTRADFLAMGSILALAWGTPAIRDRCIRLASRRWMPLIPIATAGILAALVDARLDHAMSYPLKAACTGLLLMQLLLIAGRGGWQILDHPAARWLAALSYPLYLYHLLLWPVAARAFDAGPARTAFWLVSALAVAAASYYAIERPILALRDRLFPAHPRARGTGHTAPGGAGLADVPPARMRA